MPPKQKALEKQAQLEEEVNKSVSLIVEKVCSNEFSPRERERPKLNVKNKRLLNGPSAQRIVPKQRRRKKKRPKRQEKLQRRQRY